MMFEEVGIDCTLTYSFGEFVEKYETSVIFGVELGEVMCVVLFDVVMCMYIMMMMLLIGYEMMMRCVCEDGKEMMCERRFVSNDVEVEVDVTCVEIFVW